MISEEQTYFRLKESKRAIYDQLNDFEWDTLVEYGERVGQNETKCNT